MANFNKYSDEAIIREGSSSDEEEKEAVNFVKDDDICKNAATEFPMQFKPNDEAVTSLQKDYVLSLGADSLYTRLAVGLSNAAVHIYDINARATLSNHYNLTDNGEASNISICGVRFLDDSPNLLLVGSTDGLVRLFDLRTSGEQSRYKYQTNSFQVPESITCFDRNANGRVICCGTEEYMSNVFLLFFDVRTQKQMGAFYESHEKEVTSVRFHKNNPDLLCSGSVDGLINIYDIKEPDEDEALQNTINTESSVCRLYWSQDVYNKDIVSCITNTHDFMSYECDEADEVVSFERPEITAGIRRSNPANFNLVNAHNTADDGIFLLADTNRGKILRSVCVMKKKLQPLANYEGNKQIVRDSLFDPKRNLLITGGECGIITLWTSDAAPETSIASSGKIKSKTKSNKMTPY